jgi:hypothetical protein
MEGAKANTKDQERGNWLEPIDPVGARVSADAVSHHVIFVRKPRPHLSRSFPASIGHLAGREILPRGCGA